MFPETILVTNAVRDLLGHEDRANAGVPVCFYSQNQKKRQGAWSRNGRPSAETLPDSLNVRRFVIAVELPGVCYTHPYIKPSTVRDDHAVQQTHGPFHM